MSLTASTHVVIPVLIGRGLTEGSARAALTRAKLFGVTTAQVGAQKVVPISHMHGKFTIGEVR
jgi:hypothetical protein